MLPRLVFEASECVAETAQAQIPGADPERHGCLGARVDVLGVSGRHAASVAFVCCHLPPGEARTNAVVLCA